ncbi:MAG TPA: hypothetical protein EYQ54_04070 [Myxococcales bacterium]|nr:hypothetical protein [Myxococcales bacterium]
MKKRLLKECLLQERLLSEHPLNAGQLNTGWARGHPVRASLANQPVSKSDTAESKNAIRWFEPTSGLWV